jgi:dolichyl-phosphate-mannose-protein mannosyltransferase
MRPQQPPPSSTGRGTVGLRVGRTAIDPDEHIVTRRVVSGGSGGGDDGPGSSGGRFAPARVVRAILERDWLVILLLIAIAAALRLPGLEGRGRFEFDQGGDMLTLRALTQDGVIPLLGPKASVGDFHHGVLTFFLLAPSAWLSGSEPLGVTLEMALLGIAAVVATWWFGRVVGGRAVGLVAGLLLAVSPAAVEESIFIWNPNPIPLFAALAAGSAWRGHQTGRARWWVLALGSAAVVAQLHILGLVFVVPILGLLLADLWSTRGGRGEPGRRRALIRGLVGGAAIAAAFYLPLAIEELQSGFSEVHAVLAYLGAGTSGNALDPLERLLVTGFRVVGWPFVGLVTEVPIAASIVFAVVISLLTWHAVTARGEGAGPARWLALTAAWSIVALTIVAPTLSRVVIGLPDDHYHAFMDPILVVAVALAGAAIARGGAGVVRDAAGARAAVVARVDVAARALLVLALVGTVGLALGRQPIADPNGGWPAARAAGDRLVATLGTAPVGLVNLPVFEPADWIGFPIVHAGGTIAPDLAGAHAVVVGCDRLFEQVIGDACGGPAEARWLATLVGPAAAGMIRREQFDLSPRISISIYEAPAIR